MDVNDKSMLATLPHCIRQAIGDKYGKLWQPRSILYIYIPLYILLHAHQSFSLMLY